MVSVYVSVTLLPEPDLVSAVAVIVTLLLIVAEFGIVTNPLEFTVAKAVLLLDQLTVVGMPVPVSDKVPAIVNCWFVPRGISLAVLDMFKLCSNAGSTVMVITSCITSSELADLAALNVISTVLPSTAPFGMSSFPEAVTMAVDVFELLQVNAGAELPSDIVTLEPKFTLVPRGTLIAEPLVILRLSTFGAPTVSTFVATTKVDDPVCSAAVAVMVTAVPSEAPLSTVTSPVAALTVIWLVFDELQLTVVGMPTVSSLNAPDMPKVSDVPRAIEPEFELIDNPDKTGEATVIVDVVIMSELELKDSLAVAVMVAVSPIVALLTA